MDAFSRFLAEVQNSQPREKTSSYALGLEQMSTADLNHIANVVRNTDPTKVSHFVPVIPEAQRVNAGRYPYGLTSAEASILNKVAAVDFAARQMTKESTRGKYQRKRENQAARQAEANRIQGPEKRPYTSGPSLIGGNEPKPSGKLVLPGPETKPDVKLVGSTPKLPVARNRPIEFDSPSSEVLKAPAETGGNRLKNRAARIREIKNITGRRKKLQQKAQAFKERMTVKPPTVEPKVQPTPKVEPKVQPTPKVEPPSGGGGGAKLPASSGTPSKILKKPMSLGKKVGLGLGTTALAGTIGYAAHRLLSKDKDEKRSYVDLEDAIHRAVKKKYY